MTVLDSVPERSIHLGSSVVDYVLRLLTFSFLFKAPDSSQSTLYQESLGARFSSPKQNPHSC